MRNKATDVLLGVLLAQRREHRAGQLRITAAQLLTKAAEVDGLDRQLGAGYRGCATRLSREAATLTEGNQP